MNDEATDVINQQAHRRGLRSNRGPASLAISAARLGGASRPNSHPASPAHIPASLPKRTHTFKTPYLKISPVQPITKQNGTQTLPAGTLDLLRPTEVELLKVIIIREEGIGGCERVYGDGYTLRFGVVVWLHSREVESKSGREESKGGRGEKSSGEMHNGQVCRRCLTVVVEVQNTVKRRLSLRMST